MTPAIAHSALSGRSGCQQGMTINKTEVSPGTSMQVCWTRWLASREGERNIEMEFKCLIGEGKVLLNSKINPIYREIN